MRIWDIRELSVTGKFKSKMMRGKPREPDWPSGPGREELIENPKDRTRWRRMITSTVWHNTQWMNENQYFLDISWNWKKCRKPDNPWTNQRRTEDADWWLVGHERRHFDLRHQR